MLLDMKTLATAIIAIGLCFAATSASAQTFETGVPGLVVKNLTCGAMNIVNRTENHMQGELIVIIYDSDNDPVDLRYLPFNLPPKSGKAAKVFVASCHANKFNFRLTS
jgi:hypothetical protein